MDFLINLTLTFAVFGISFGLLSWFSGEFDVVCFIQLLSVFISCCLTFYLAVQGAVSWGATIRTAFVVFRQDLHQRLRLRQVTDYEDERYLWQLTSQFFRVESHENQQIELGKMIFDESSYYDKDASDKLK